MIDKIKIGGIHYDVKYVERLQDDDRSPLNGQISYVDARIDVDANMVAQKTMQTILHEILHGILAAANHNTTEEVIDSTAYGLLQVLRDNPQLIDAVKELG